MQQGAAEWTEVEDRVGNHAFDWDRLSLRDPSGDEVQQLDCAHLGFREKLGETRSLTLASETLEEAGSLCLGCGDLSGAS